MPLQKKHPAPSFSAWQHLARSAFQHTSLNSKCQIVILNNTFSISCELDMFEASFVGHLLSQKEDPQAPGPRTVGRLAICGGRGLLGDHHAEEGDRNDLTGKLR